MEIPEEPYEGKQNVIISYVSPTGEVSGGLIETGYLWWSPLTGKLYIYYRDEDGNNSWVITNPVGFLSTPYSLDYIPEGDGGGELPPVTPLPIDPEGPGGDGGQLGPIKLNKGESLMWFEHLKDFLPGDNIRFMAGAPGTGLTEDAKILRILEQYTPACISVGNLDSSFPMDKCSKHLSFAYTVTTPTHRLNFMVISPVQNSMRSAPPPNPWWCD